LDNLSFKDGKQLSHAYIVASASAEDRAATALRLAQALVCSGGGAVPCGVCRDCRKARDGVHPDVIYIRRQRDDNGTPKKELLVEQVRYMVGDAYVLPNEAARKVYVVEDADTMNASAQNAALKLLEEPPKAAAFILCAANPAMLLPTVRSRCVELRRNSDSDVPDEASGRLAGEFLAAADTGSRAEVLKWCVGHEGLEPAAARDFVSAVLAEVDERLCFRAPAGNFDRRQLMRLWELFTKCRDYLGANTGVRHVFGLLAVDAVPDGKDNQ